MKKYLLGLILLSLALYSCKVVDYDPEKCKTIPTPVPYKGKYYRMSSLKNDDGYQENYEYNSKGELVKTTNSTGYTINYNYQNSKVEIVEKNKEGMLMNKKICFLNVAGFQEKEELFENEKLVSFKKFKYDDKGYLIEETKHNLTGELLREKKWKIEGDRIVSLSENDLENNFQYNFDLKYDTTLINPLTSQINGIFFKGNATKGVILTDIGGGKIYFYSYSFNKNGYVEKRRYSYFYGIFQTKEGWTDYSYKWTN